MCVVKAGVGVGWEGKAPVELAAMAQIRKALVPSYLFLPVTLLILRRLFPSVCCSNHPSMS